MMLQVRVCKEMKLKHKESQSSTKREPKQGKVQLNVRAGGSRSTINYAF